MTLSMTYTGQARAPTVLFDGFHLAGSGGTGIATYARNVASVVHELGYRTEAVFGVEAKVRRSTPLLSMVGLFDAQSDAPQRRITRLLRYLSIWPGAPFGLRPYRVPVDDGVVAAGHLKTFDHIHIARRTFERARAHFLRTGRLARLNVEGRIDAFHATYPLPMMVPGRANIVTIHDLIPLRLPHVSLDDKRYYYAMVKAAADNADRIVTVSEHSRRDIVQLLQVPEDKVTNTYQSFALQPAGAPETVAADIRNAFGLEAGGYFLFYGALEPKKNVARLVEAYALSGAKRPLIIAGGLGWQYEEALKRIEDEKFLRLTRDGDGGYAISRKVRRIPYVPPEFLSVLIAGARAVLFPSLYEGFGLPVVESMSLGTAVLTSTTSSLPEVAGDAAMLVDPTDVRALAQAIRQLETDDTLVAGLKAKGPTRAALFSREAYKERLKAVYAKTVGSAS